MKLHSLIFSLLLLINSFTTAVLSSDADIQRIFRSTRIGHTQSVDVPYSGELHFFIGHRFGELNGGFYDIFGLDLATIRLGFDYGITDEIEIGIGRSTFEKSYDFFSKFAILKQSANGSPIAVTLNLTSSVNTLRNFYPDTREGIWDRSSFSAQLMVARKQGILSLQATPLFFRNNYEIRSEEALNMFAFPLSASIRVSKRFSILTQLIPILNKPEYIGNNPFSTGLEIDTGGHQFQLLFSNSRGMFDKSLLTDTEGNWTKGKIYFGFNLVRIFYLNVRQ